MLFFLTVATETLGLPVVTAWMSGIASYLPKILAAALIGCAGLIGSVIVRDLVLTTTVSAGLAHGAMMGRLAQVAVLLVTVLIGIEQLDIDITFLTSVITIGLGALLFGAALAFGLGARTAVSNILASYYLGDVLERLRAFRARRIVDMCVVDEAGHLVAVVPRQEIAVAQPTQRIGELVQSQPISIHAMAPREDVVTLLEECKLASLPVVDLDGKLLGIIRYDTLVVATAQVVSQDVQAMFGAGRDERALSKASFAVRKRLPWLVINLGTAFLAATVVGLFEDTIARITALAIFLPVVAGQSGNTGSQALAVTMRGLALREIRSHHVWRIVCKEVAAGFVNGCVIAVTTSLIVYLWMQSSGLAVVIGTSMVFSISLLANRVEQIANEWTRLYAA